MSVANIAFVQDLYAAFGCGDIATLLAGLNPQIDWQSKPLAKERWYDLTYRVKLALSFKYDEGDQPDMFAERS